MTLEISLLWLEIATDVAGPLRGSGRWVGGQRRRTEVVWTLSTPLGAGPISGRALAVPAATARSQPGQKQPFCCVLDADLGAFAHLRSGRVNWPICIVHYAGLQVMAQANNRRASSRPPDSKRYIADLRYYFSLDHRRPL